ncbi:MAG TPA: carbohydrate porin [Stellaceae bacterium]|nr:carbohydrate porin [Stellaceae bacterium]
MPFPKREGRTASRLLFVSAGLLAACATGAFADSGDEPDAVNPEIYDVHAQFTEVTQYHPPFASPYRGPNSLDPGHRGDETIDGTVFAGVRLFPGLAAYADAEVDQGFGLSDTLGVAGFPSGEAYKVGSAEPYVRLPRAFLRETIDLGGEAQTVKSDQNQLAGTHAADNITITLGKFSVTDIFDTNDYAHDPKQDFLNWSIIDAGAFDYAADAWGYTYGAAAEWTQSWWTLRGGVFDLSRVPNDRALVRGFGQFETDAELEVREQFFGQNGKVKLLAFLNRGRMADYNDAVREGEATGTVPSVAKVRRYASRPGLILNVQQGLTETLGAFLRISVNDGHKEAYEFTEVNRSVSGGLSLSGKAWGRDDDTVGLAGVINGISGDARAYLAAGGLGILIGDGRLEHYDTERILELYYKASVVEGVDLSADIQRVENPGYNADRGPVSIFALRIHAEI